MKFICIHIIALLMSLASYAQLPRSQKLENITHLELVENKIIRTDSVVMQINE